MNESRYLTKFEPTRTRRILVVNPNSNRGLTALVQEAADRVVGQGTVVDAVNPDGGPLSIETLDDRSRAEPLAIDLLARHHGYDAYVMACFDDIGIGSARRFLRAPIVGAVEASVSLARLYAPRFGIVTTVESMVPGIRALTRELGVADRCSVRASGVGVADAASAVSDADARIDAAIEAARNYDGAEVIILGSGGLAGRAEALIRRHGIPVIDSIEAAISLGELAAASSCRMRGYRPTS
ncbi:aspartate/glutamate racemase family protein [Histidinibacterium aquaticum]|uniref:Asp/Glu racemase n=1 Tax=Histidinibacterium aquaticum TaxID=2613962 RepID=A0A5J5GQI9_9RHOB|nr:aspartate/glutamate racemase family protein [Histidinibacterium aquaticum]KAA9010023.1 Asp/Glu racemase [Histidinibacterium aquaticum]